MIRFNEGQTKLRTSRNVQIASKASDFGDEIDHPINLLSRGIFHEVS